MYDIKKRTYKKAKELGIQIFPSDNPKYKIEIYDYNGIFITYIGDAASAGDYPTYLELEKSGEKPKGYAEKRRDLYWNRHLNEIERLGDEWEGSRSYYAFALLWS
jgi:hypothetical protein